jgi:hypothetical protein
MPGTFATDCPQEPNCPRSFKPLSQDVTNCPRCQRRTPAARGECIYCGEHLPFAIIQSAPPQRNIDTIERAFNTVLDPFPARVNESVIAALASALQIELNEAQAFIEAGKPLPLARSQTRAEADMISALIRTCGLRASIISDEDMMLDSDLMRARRLTTSDNQIQVHSSNGAVVLRCDEISLLVLGELRNVRVDYTEGLSSGRSQGNVLDSSEYRSDETLLDVYTSSLERSFRIKADAFDYSGLVSPMSFRSEVNFQSALKALQAAAPNAKVDNDFPSVRCLLSRAWPERSRNESRGIKRSGLAFRAVAQASVTSDNKDQFDRYSRLMFLTKSVN